METNLKAGDAVLLRETVSAITDRQVWETLEVLARRELDLLEDPRIGGDPEMRRASIWNAAAMVAAAERFVTQPRTEAAPREP